MPPARRRSYAPFVRRKSGGFWPALTETNAPVKTTIGDVSLYDNVCFVAKFLTEYGGDHGVVKYDQTDFHNHLDVAKLAVSDRRPVWAKFRTDQDDGN